MGNDSTHGHHGTHNPNTASGLGNAAGYESTSGYGNNTGYQESTSRGIGADAPQQGNHYTTTAVAGKLGNALGLDATHRVDDSSARTTTTGRTGNNTTSSTARESDHSHKHGLGGVGNVGDSGFHASGLGSDRSAVKDNDRYLFNASNAPGGGGRHSRLTDDFTDDNIHHEGSGRGITGALGSDASSGVAGVSGVGSGSGSGLGSNTTSHTSTSGLASGSNTERSRKPGFQRTGTGSGLSYGTGSHGLNSGRPKESIGTRLEEKVEQYAPGAGLAGAGAAAGYGTSRSGQQGSQYDDTSRSGRGYESQDPARVAGENGEPYGADAGVSQATSGVSGLNLNQKRSGGDATYSGNQGAYNTSSRVSATEGVPFPGSNNDRSYDDKSRSGNSGAGLATAGLAGAGLGAHSSNKDNYASPTGPGLTSTGERGNGDGRDFGVTSPHNANDSTFGIGGLEGRIAGAPSEAGPDGCVDMHHNAHATGPQAHIDGSHKPTFLNYQHDQFGIPGAKGQ